MSFKDVQSLYGDIKVNLHQNASLIVKSLGFLFCVSALVFFLTAVFDLIIFLLFVSLTGIKYSLLVGTLIHSTSVCH